MVFKKGNINSKTIMKVSICMKAMFDDHTTRFYTKTPISKYLTVEKLSAIYSVNSRLKTHMMRSKAKKERRIKC